MLIRFTSPDLARLDELDAEVLAVGVHEDVRPAKGVAGLCDWRLGGLLSRLMMRGFLTGRVGEVVMVPGKPKLSFDKLLLLGLGAGADMGPDRLRDFVRRLTGTLSKLRARAAIVDLPGTEDGLVTATAAVDILLAEAGGTADFDSWTLVESPESRAVMETHLSEQRRRVRRTL